MVMIRLISRLAFSLVACTVGAAQAQTVAPAPAAAAAAAATATATATAAVLPIYLYSSPITKAFFAANGTNYDTLKGHWEEFLRTHHQRSSRQISRAELLEGLKPGVLLLGSAVLLDAKEREAISRFGDSGGAIVASWGTGARDGKGQWAGYGFVEGLFDIKIKGVIANGKNERFLNTFGDHPLSGLLPAGERIFMGDGAEQPLRIDGPQLAGRYFDWGRMPTAKDSNGAVAFTEKNGSRRVYLSFAESSWDYDERKALPRLLNGVFAWVRRQPQIMKAAWPDGAQSAQLLEMDTEDKYPNAEGFAKDLEANGLRGTFYSLTSIALKHKDVVDRLAAKHEIGYHAEVHTGFKGKSEAAQTDRLKTMVDHMKEMVGSRALPKVTGFRAPTESYDPTTEKVLRSLGVKHHVVDPSATESRLPFFSKSEIVLGSEDAIVVLPRTQLDDLNYLGLKLSLEQATALIGLDFDYLHEAAALGVLSVHSQNYGTEGLMTQLAPVYLKQLQAHRKDVWTATGGEIEAWWRARERVLLNAALDETGKPAPRDATVNNLKTLDFTVKAPGNVRGLSFIVSHPAKGVMPKISQATGAAAALPLPEVRAIDAFRSSIVFPTALAAGQYGYSVGFN
jgi:peptidoglycan/xylan/chitin deacetylase (PgdA/CDA1 family)